MQQQTAGAAFLGRVVEEKFHMKLLSLSIIPCVPLVCNSLKHMVHPEVGPTQLSEGVKEGYFLVNLSAVQNFDIGPEFFESTFAVNDDLGIITIFVFKKKRKKKVDVACVITNIYNINRTYGHSIR